MKERRVGTRIRMTRDARRRQLLAVAQDMIATQGIEALSMNGLADAARVAKPVVYSHFPNIDEAVVALLDDYYESRRSYVRGVTDHARTLEQYLQLLLEASFEFERDSKLRVQQIGSGYSSRPAVNAAFDRFNGHLRRFWRDLLEEQNVPATVAEIAAYPLTITVLEATAHFAVAPQRAAAITTLRDMILGIIRVLSLDPQETVPTVHVDNYTKPADVL